MSIKQYVFVLTPVLAILLAGCSRHSSSSAVGSVDLSNIPNASSMAAASSSSSAASNSMLKERALSLQSSGTPPTFLSIAESSSLIDSDIFGGVVTTINQAGSATSGANGTGAQFFWSGEWGPRGNAGVSNAPRCRRQHG